MDTKKWYLMKHDDSSVFGPMNFDHLRQWAVDAYISPLDKVSNDSENWIKAPMVPELQMDYLLEVSENYYYGPTTVGAVRAFLAEGEIDETTPVTNCKTGECKPLAEFEIFRAPDQEELSDARGDIREHLSNRLQELEELLLAERRLRLSAEEEIIRLREELARLK